MPSYTAVAIQLYADVLVFVIRQRDLFRRLPDTDETQFIIDVVNTVRQFENESLLFIADNCGYHIYIPPIVIDSS